MHRLVTDQAMGSVSWSAHEVLYGSAQKKSDVFSIGALLYFSLTRRPPYVTHKRTKRPPPLPGEDWPEGLEATEPTPAAEATPTANQDVDALVARAQELDAAHAYGEAAAIWLEIHRRPEADPPLRSRAAYEAQGALRLDYTRRRKPTSLCEAFAVVDEHLRAHGTTLEASTVQELAGYRREIRSQLTVHRDVHGPVPCPVVFQTASEFVPVAAPEPAQPVPADRQPPPEDDRKPGRGLAIAGGLSLAASATLIGVMAYGIHALTAEASTCGGFSGHEWTQGAGARGGGVENANPGDRHGGARRGAAGGGGRDAGGRGEAAAGSSAGFRAAAGAAG